MSGAGFLLDLHRCVGCGACVLACRIENGRVVKEGTSRDLENDPGVREAYLGF